MYRKPVCWRRVEVTTKEDGYYSGNGFLSAIDRQSNMVCVYFIGKGHVWFDRSLVKPFKWLSQLV